VRFIEVEETSPPLCTFSISLLLFFKLEKGASLQWKAKSSVGNFYRVNDVKSVISI